MKKNKVVFPLIIILLLCFLPCSIYGIYHQVVLKKELGNPKHLHKFANQLFYYDDQDELIGVYKCETDVCDDAKTQIDDEYLKYYAGGSDFDLGVFGGGIYTFINDGEGIKLHSIKTDRTIATFSLIKNYGAIVGDGKVIVKNNDGLYGLFNLNTVSFDIAAKYSFMGLADNFADGTLSADRIAVKENNEWYIIDLDEKQLSSPVIYPIYDYDKQYIYHINENNNYLIYMYDGSLVLPGVVIKKIDSINNYHILINGSGEVLIYDQFYKEIVERYQEFGASLDYKIESTQIDIYNGEKIIDTFNLENGE